MKVQVSVIRGTSIIADDYEAELLTWRYEDGHVEVWDAQSLRATYKADSVLRVRRLDE